LTTRPKKFNAKILLLGEYTVTLGSGALAVPYRKFGGHWSQHAKHEVISEGLTRLMSHVQSSNDLAKVYRTEDFQQDLSDGLFFESDIPQGYGLGSSGALVAAFYDTYAYQKAENIHELKSVLARTECAFHGASSGIDPLVSCLDKPVLYRGNNLQTPEVPLDLSSFFLLDTGMPRNTAQLVGLFRERMDTSAGFRRAISALSDYNDEAIENVIHSDYAVLFKLMGHISQLQLEHLQAMIPAGLINIWKKGLDSGDYLLKICGAGGGGMMMGLRPEGSVQPEYLGAYPPISLV